MQYVSLIQSLPSIRPWVPWCIVAALGMIYISLVSCVDQLTHCLLIWDGVLHPATLLCLVAGAGLITIPLYYAAYIPPLALFGVLGYALMLLHHVTVYEYYIWIPAIARFFGVANVCVGLYITADAILGLQGRRNSIWMAYRFTLPLMILPQVLLIVLTDPL
jgi:hypothetical protein